MRKYKSNLIANGGQYHIYLEKRTKHVALEKDFDKSNTIPLLQYEIIRRKKGISLLNLWYLIFFYGERMNFWMAIQTMMIGHFDWHNMEKFVSPPLDMKI